MYTKVFYFIKRNSLVFRGTFIWRFIALKIEKGQR